MKIFITGHTSGIGYELFNILTEHHEVWGGSRRIGWDVGDSRFYDQVLDFDVLVNNAYHETGQLALLKFVYSHWKNTPKIIINVGSAHIDHQIHRPFDKVNYNVTKAAIRHYSTWISENDNICKSMMFNPGHVNTPLARETSASWPDIDKNRAQERQINASDCANTIKFMIESGNNFREVTQV